MNFGSSRSCWRGAAGRFHEGIPIQNVQSDAAAPGLYGLRVTAIDRREAGPQPAQSSSTCPACGESEVRPRFHVEGLTSEIVDCTRCGVGRFEPMLEREKLRAFYPDDYYAIAEVEPEAGSGAASPERGRAPAKFNRGIEWMVRLVAARHVAFLARDLPRGARVLDLGCGRGVVLNPLAERGIAAVGVEITEAAAVGLDPRVELHVADRLQDVAFPGEHFDQVIVWHVLEHLVDPLETLVECHRILRPGGRLIVAVPNYSSLQARITGRGWFHLDPPRHLYQFTLEGLRQIVRRSGFAVRTEHHFSLRQNPFGWIQSAINLCVSRPNRLYEFLQGMGKPPTPSVRALHWLQLAAGAPFAIGLTLVAAWLRSGATVHFVAERKEDAPGA